MTRSSPALHPSELIDDTWRVRPEGQCSLVEAVELVKSAIAHCRDRNVSKLLFNGTGLEGIAMPNLVDRFLMVEEWASAADGMVVVALVVQPEYIHPEKFGVVVAADLGLTCDVYSSEENALRWLAEA